MNCLTWAPRFLIIGVGHKGGTTMKKALIGLALVVVVGAGIWTLGFVAKKTDRLSFVLIAGMTDGSRSSTRHETRRGQGIPQPTRGPIHAVLSSRFSGQSDS